MSVSIRIPTPWRRLTGNQASVAATGQDVQAVLANLETQYPGFRKELYDDSGALNQFINVYVNAQEIGSLAGQNTEVSDGDVISIIPAIAGGADTGRTMSGRGRGPWKPQTGAHCRLATW